MKTNIKYLLIILLLSAATAVKAQSRVADTTGSALSQRLTVQAGRAKTILNAENYHRDDIARLMMNKSIPAIKKQQLLKKLLAERRRVIDSLVTPEEQQQIKTYQGAQSAKLEAQIKERVRQQK